MSATLVVPLSITAITGAIRSGAILAIPGATITFVSVAGVIACPLSGPMMAYRTPSRSTQCTMADRMPGNPAHCRTGETPGLGRASNYGSCQAAEQRYRRELLHCY